MQSGVEKDGSPCVRGSLRASRNEHIAVGHVSRHHGRGDLQGGEAIGCDRNVDLTFIAAAYENLRNSGNALVTQFDFLINDASYGLEIVGVAREGHDKDGSIGWVIANDRRLL